jgi:hypothetical protein
MLMDFEKNYLLIELRDIEAHQVSFAGIDLKDGHLLWNDLKFEESWWLNMVAVYQGCILFKIHDDDQSHQSSTYFLYNPKVRQIVWESPDFNFLRVINKGFIGIREQENSNILILLNHENGNETILNEENEDHSYKNSFNKPSENKKLRSPFHYLEDSEYFEIIKKFLNKNHNILPLKGVDYLELQKSIIISYYIYQRNPEKKAPFLENYLLVIDRYGNKLLQEKIDEKLTGIGLETFFVIDDQLIFTSFKRNIKSYFIT